MGYLKVKLILISLTHSISLSKVNLLIWNPVVLFTLSISLASTHSNHARIVLKINVNTESVISYLAKRMKRIIPNYMVNSITYTHIAYQKYMCVHM